MTLPYLSIIIPTYNRAEKLDRALQHLYDQELAHESFEVIVVDDGSMDHTDSVLSEWKKKWPQLSALHQSNSGQATARNRGIKAARGQILLLGQDDIYASPGFLKAHVEFHKSHPQENQAVLGLTEWWPEAPVTPFMQWLTHGGPQFAYHLLQAGQTVSYWFFYTSNISLKTQLLKDHPFDESFSSYGWEDIELGYRLMKQGLTLHYQPQALAWHDHFMDEKDFKKRMHSIGKGAVKLEARCPGIGVVPAPWKRRIFKALSHTAPVFFLRLVRGLHPRLRAFYYYALSKRYFLEGLRSV